jgi:hypothetical protein
MVVIPIAIGRLDSDGFSDGLWRRYRRFPHHWDWRRYGCFLHLWDWRRYSGILGVMFGDFRTGALLIAATVASFVTVHLCFAGTGDPERVPSLILLIRGWFAARRDMSTILGHRHAELDRFAVFGLPCGVRVVLANAWHRSSFETLIPVFD